MTTDEETKFWKVVVILLAALVFGIIAGGILNVYIKS